MEKLEIQTTKRHHAHQMILRTRIQSQKSSCVSEPHYKNTELSTANTEYIARNMNPDIMPYYIGPMTNVCPHCDAMRFMNEALNCCHNGKVSLPQLSSYPEELKDLLMSNSSQAKNFKENIRQYNSAFAFASLGAKIDKIKTRGPYCFRIHGQIYHQTGCLHPSEGKDHKYGQVYILEGDQGVASRMKIQENSLCRPDTIRQIQEIMGKVSPYAAAYKHMYEVEKEQIKQFGAQANSVKMIFKRGFEP